jgi:uncharacterized membrane protein
VVLVTSVSGLETPLLRALFGLPFLLASGYALYTALSYLQQPRHATPTPLFERALYTIAFTLALVVVGGIVLNNTSWGIHRESWTIYLAFTAIGASLFGIMRRQDHVSFAITVSPRRIFLVAAYIGTILLALVLSFVGDQTRPADHFTMFWTLPDRAQANLLDIGIGNEERAPQDYHVSLLLDGVHSGSYPSIELAPGAAWSISLSLPPGVTTVEAQLFRSGDTTLPYRSTHLEWGALQQLETQP